MGYQLGIDLGTATTIVALADGDWPQVLTVAGSPSTPTVLYFPDRTSQTSARPAATAGPAVFGRAAQRRALADPARAATGFVARVGDPAPILAAGAAYQPEGLLTRFLERLVAAVAESRGENPDRVVVAFPTSWNARRRELFTEALDRLDVDVPVSATPAAEALGAVLSRRATARTPGRAADLVAIYDFGAGSCETAVLSVTDFGCDVVGSPNGLGLAGGADVDSLLLEHVLRQAFPEGTPAGLDRSDPATAAALARLRADVVAAKETLAADDETSVAVTLPGVFTWVTLRRDDLERLVTPAVEDSVRALTRTIRSVPVTPDGLSAVLLCGGVSRMPLVERMVRAALPGARRFEQRPAEDVAIGAALLAASLAAQEEPAAGATALIAPDLLSQPPEPSSFPSVPPPGGGSSAPATTGGVLAAGPTRRDDTAATALIAAAYASFPATTTGGPGDAGAAGARAAAAVTAGDATAWPVPAAGSGSAGGPPGGRPPAGGERGRDGSRALRSLRTRGGIAALVAAVLFIGGGTALGVMLTASGGGASAGPSLVPSLLPSVTAPAGASGTPAVTPRNLVKVADSAEVAPISELAADDFRQHQPNVTVSDDITTTDDAFAKLCKGQVAIAGTSYELDPQFAPDPSCKDQVVPFEIAHHTLPIVVNPQNTWLGCQNLTQLKKLWDAGSTVTNWNQLDPSFPNAPIDFVGPARDSVQAQMFDASVAGSAGQSRSYTVKDLAGVAQTVESDPDAIGFLDFPTYETAGSQLRGVLVDGGQGCQPPNAVTAGTGLYLPLCKPLYVYARKDALRDPATAAYLRYYLQNEQTIATMTHYVPRDQATVTDNVNQLGQLTQGVGPVPS
jgi:ABC-type phosphate transport system substrate-binding protein/actin-like ATPase involved in cell morphogenesis